jgi:hypothetical protein
MALVGLMAVVAAAQQTHWVVKPEWVHAHEDFLASDILHGRGSATRDEEITATYVASEFEAYGLKFAPGMNSYLQRGEVIAPELDGKATIKAGSVTLREGVDFDLAASSATNTSGPVVKVDVSALKSTKIERGSVLLLTGAKNQDAVLEAIGSLRRVGAAAVLVVETPQTTGVFGVLGGRTRTPIRLAEGPARRGGSNVAIVHGAAAKPLESLGAGAVVSLNVTALPTKESRYTYNTIGYLPGSDPKAGTILLSAHLDHLGIGRAVNGDSIYNGANDDAAGTTAVMELAHALGTGARLKRSVLFLCYGSEEAGELGSLYFGMHPVVPLKELVTNLEFEMIGNQDPKMPKGVMLLTGWDRSNLGPTLAKHGALLGPDPYPEQHFFERSDNYQLALKGVVAHTAAGWGTVPTYHQPNDDLAHVDFAYMTAAVQSLVEPVRWLADSDFKPEWNSGGQPHN